MYCTTASTNSSKFNSVGSAGFNHQLRRCRAIFGDRCCDVPAPLLPAANGWQGLASKRQSSTTHPAATSCAAYAALRPASSPATQTLVAATPLASTVDVSTGAWPDLRNLTRVVPNIDFYLSKEEGRRTCARRPEVVVSSPKEQRSRSPRSRYAEAQNQRPRPCARCSRLYQKRRCDSLIRRGTCRHCER